MTSAHEDTNLVVTFLESVGSPQDAFFYLRLFRELPKQSFAVVCVTPEVLGHLSLTLAEPIAFLAKLGLHVTVATGLWDNADTESAESPPADLSAVLGQLGSGGERVDLGEAGAAAHCATVLRAGRTAVVDLRAANAESPAHALAYLTAQLGTRKVIVLRSRGGLGPHRNGLVKLTATHELATHGNGISIINLTTDYDELQRRSELAPAEKDLLQTVRVLHAGQPKLLTSVTSPLNFFQELFTIKGAGTLIKTGSQLLTLSSYEQLDTARLSDLLESTFERRLRPGFLQVAPLNIYVEKDFRGAAIVYPGLGASFLTKFAVTRDARGEGMGRDLWETLRKDHPALYWRARTANPIAAWYRTLCDGMQIVGDWVVFWRGIPPRRVAEVIEDACDRPQDFVDHLPTEAH